MYKFRCYIEAALSLALLTLIIVLPENPAMAQGGASQAVASGGINESAPWLAYAAMGAVGISCAASSYALSKIGAAAMGAMSEKPEVGGRALIFLGMAEGIAIYGLIIAIMLVNKI